MIAEIANTALPGGGLHMRVQGAGPDLVLLHGWGLSGAVFDALVPLLASRYRVHCVDLPGHGASASVALESSDVLSRLLEALPERAIWFGWSLGGVLALQAAHQAPGRIAGVVTLATSPRFLAAPDWPCGLQPGVLQSFAEGLRDDYAATLTRFLALQTRGLAGGRETLRTLRIGLASAPPAPAALASGLQILRGSDLRAILPGLGARLHMWFGDRDPLVPSGAAAAVARLAPQAQVERVQGWGHAPFLADPRGLASRLERMLDD
jgi:pimeloyl-[acyl-carrier protein] methyl ester esterase